MTGPDRGRSTLMSKVFATELGVELVVLCLVETLLDLIVALLVLIVALLVLVVVFFEVVVGVPLTIMLKARHAVRRMDWGFMAGRCGDIEGVD